MSLELVPFAVYTAKLNKPDLVASTPKGQRVVVGVKESRWEGERFAASQRGDTAGDWLITGPDGTAMVDVRMTLRTDDGAFVYVEYGGRADWSDGPGSRPAYIAPQFETGDERYLWLNKIQFVGKGELAGDQVRYEIFELR